MTEFVLLGDDIVNFLPSFGAATIAPVPGTITASGDPMTVGPAVCVEGDEESVSVSGVPYMTADNPVPGTGTVTITALADAHLSKTMTVGGKKVLLVAPSAQFEAELAVDTKASNPPANTTDGTGTHSGGKGMFVGTNLKVKAG